jgi:serine/threonine-protein kinase
MDFGIARMRSADQMTSTGIIVGTPRFMSPEQVSGQPVDQRSDLFSLGAVLYEMLTGVQVFAADDTPQIAHKITTFEPEPPSYANPEVTSMLDFVVARVLKKDPAVRYQDAYELAADLRTCLAELQARRSPARAAEGTKTVKLEAASAKAPAAVAIAPDTRLPLSRQFDCSDAVQRLATPGRRDRASLARAPGAVGLLRRIRKDAGPRLLFASVLVAGAAGAWIAFG